MKTQKKIFILTTLLLVQPVTSFAENTNDMFGSWTSVTLQGDFQGSSPELSKKFKWQIMDQGRTRDDSAQGSRFTENFLFAQVGYQLNDNALFALGYTHDWIHPLNRVAYQESRPSQDFIWNQEVADEFKFMSRTRMEERINLTTDNVGYRARELLQVSHALPFLDGLSAYVGDEVLFYLNKNNFGKQGFSENYALAGFSYQFTPNLGLDLGYVGQYTNNIAGNNLFIHNLQTNLRYKF